ncbi:uncharacterized protein LOC110460096 [Mizuhopecten yessoensis]|uniref:uncharacterized protein LOC110460096 n=1 Tax=Mizuhopecten yessoensis TaxID=6573 RepID=UPI000B4580FD|nr:uncharacterized protein LOC110460096 [Mizuhopecten yessoensis]
MAFSKRINGRSLVFLVLAVCIIVSTLRLRYTSSNYEIAVKGPLPPATYDDQRKKYIVYDCSKANSGVCGGWSKRMSGILSTLVISLLTKRRFLINHDKPCALENYLVPVNFDWRYNKSIQINTASSYQDLTAHNSKTLRKYLTGDLDINTYFHQDVSFLRMDWDFTEDFRKRPNINSEIAWIQNLSYADMYKQLYYLLFKPSPLLENALKDQNMHRSRPKLACAHVRVGDNPNMPGDDRRTRPRKDIIWHHFDKLNKDEYDIFIATDSNSVKKRAKIRYPANIIDTPGRITHIEQQYKFDPCEGFLKQLLDFYLLISCDTLILTRSGFGMLAAYLRGTDSELYCLQEGDLMPCSRYTLHHGQIYPGQMHAP